MRSSGRPVRGELYRADDPELLAQSARAQELLRRLDAIPMQDMAGRTAVLHELLGTVGEGVDVRSPFRCDYGSQIHLGASVFVNSNVTILDAVEVWIGDATLIGPGVQILTAAHPLEAETRRSGLEWGEPVTIGENVWLGAGSIVLPGVTIGDNSIVGAGSVVTRDVPAGVIAVGNPCRTLRELPRAQQ